jgi:hypothetical protein
MKKMLKVRPAEIPPKKSVISFKLPDPTIALLRTYLRAYAAMYGIEPDKDFITNEIFLNFFNSDKEFMIFVKQNNIEVDGAAGKLISAGSEAVKGGSLPLAATTRA